MEDIVKSLRIDVGGSVAVTLGVVCLKVELRREEGEQQQKEFADLKLTEQAVCEKTQSQSGVQG
jgi:hypothetical protein